MRQFRSYQPGLEPYRGVRGETKRGRPWGENTQKEQHLAEKLSEWRKPAQNRPHLEMGIYCPSWKNVIFRSIPIKCFNYIQLIRSFERTRVEIEQF